MIPWARAEREDLLQQAELEILLQVQRGEQPDPALAQRIAWRSATSQWKRRGRILRRANRWHQTFSGSFESEVIWQVDFERRLKRAPEQIRNYFHLALFSQRRTNWEGAHGKRVRRILTLLITGQESGSNGSNMPLQKSADGVHGPDEWKRIPPDQRGPVQELVSAPGGLEGSGPAGDPGRLAHPSPGRQQAEQLPWEPAGDPA